MTVKQDARADGWTAADWRKNEGHRCPIHRLTETVNGRKGNQP